MTWISRPPILIFALAAPLGACDDSIFESHAGAEVTGTGYSAVFQVVTDNCFTCHSAAAKTQGLDLETDLCGATVGVPTSQYDGDFIVAGDSASSVLWAKMADTGEYGGVMPTSGGLSQENIDIVAAWIDDGASCDGSTGGDGTGGDGTGDGTGGDGTGDGTGGTTDIWTGDYSWANVQAEVLNDHCSYCHSDADPKGGLDLQGDDARAHIVGVESSITVPYVDPGNPDWSYLYMKITGTDIENAQMPKDLDPLDPELMDLVRGWIADGAPE